MSRAFLALMIASLVASAAMPVEPDPKTDWPCWRGPNRNGIAADQGSPTEWSETKNVVWKAPIPGRRHGSPIVVGSHIFLETADEEAKTQSVLCYDRTNGKELWRQELHKGGFDGRWHGKNTRASSTYGSKAAAPRGRCTNASANLQRHSRPRNRFMRSVQPV